MMRQSPAVPHMDERPDKTVMEPRATRGWASALRRRFVRSDFAYGFLSSAAAGYLRLVWATSRLTVEPGPPELVLERWAPVILTTWHSEAFLLALARPRGAVFDVMVSRAGDGELISRALRKLGNGTVRGAGSTDPSRMFEKGSVAAFRGIKAALDKRHNVVMTADFDARTHGTVSPGVVALGRLTQRPIVPVVLVTGNRLRLRSWDRTSLNLPFGRAAFVYGDAILVPRHATQNELEEKRLEIERSLAAITARAYAITDRCDG